MLNETGKSYGTKGGVATMKTADKSFSSKAMKVLLSIALVIGLAPAISPAKAYAADVTAGTITIDGVAVDAKADKTDGNGFTYSKAGIITLTGVTIGAISISADVDQSITIKADASNTSKIVATDAPAITNLSAKGLVLDATA
ncbi:MAG: hypothetical protein RR213_06500, partial [Raoultibacter sp.]